MMSITAYQRLHGVAVHSIQFRQAASRIEPQQIRSNPDSISIA
jgi:hypothetical protein